MAVERTGLGVGQRLLLLSAWLVSCGFVYVLGVYVGKGMRGSVMTAPRVALPVEVAAPPGPPADVQSPLTFYDVLGSRERSAVPPASRTPPSTARDVEDGAAAPSDRSAMTERRLDTPPSDAPDDEAAASAAVPSAVASPPPAPAVRPAAPVPPPAVRPAAGPAPSAGANPSAPPPAVASVPAQAASPAAAPPAPAPAAAPVPPAAANGRWTVYANPTRDLLAAEHERAALRAKGYAAEVVTLRRDGDLWYRIRVGRYATEAQAEEAARRLRSDGSAHGFVQSE